MHLVFSRAATQMHFDTHLSKSSIASGPMVTDDPSGGSCDAAVNDNQYLIRASSSSSQLVIVKLFKSLNKVMMDKCQ